MIEVGLTSVADHPLLASHGSTSTLVDLARLTNVVELDTPFYAIPPSETVSHWQQQVPTGFQFIVKVNQGMTGHQNLGDITALFTQWQRAMAPLIEHQQLQAAFFQWPPYFGVTTKAVRYLRWVRQLWPTMPIAMEFRHPSWYQPTYRAATLDLLTELNVIHVVVDEPQTVSASVPLVPIATNAERTIMRLHGKNTAGWLKSGAQWRHERTNYDYSDEELRQLLEAAQGIESKAVTVIFNNNGGHAAAKNAKRFLRMLGTDSQGQAPYQMDLF